MAPDLSQTVLNVDKRHECFVDWPAQKSNPQSKNYQFEGLGFSSPHVNLVKS
jgi:hypothetical protein